MSEILTDAEIKAALGLPLKCRLSRVEKELRKRNLPFEYGVKGVFAMRRLWEERMAGKNVDRHDTEQIEF